MVFPVVAAAAAVTAARHANLAADLASLLDGAGFRCGVNGLQFARRKQERWHGITVSHPGVTTHSCLMPLRQIQHVAGQGLQTFQVSYQRSRTKGADGKGVLGATLPVVRQIQRAGATTRRVRGRGGPTDRHVSQQ